MPLNIYAHSFEFYGNSLKLLAEKLRKNWMQKLSDSDQTDDSLTSLTWLYDANPISINLETAASLEGQEIKLCSALYDNYSKQSYVGSQPFTGSLLDPQIRLEYRTKWTGKPPFSYATLICLAMRELGKPKVTLSDIYGWIMNNFAYYRHTDSSWQNSVRHNLSLNKCFEKVPRDKGERGKGGFWRVNPRHIDWLEANLAKCRRAAPPPGPPPPIPRSMLLQQRKIQQQSQYQQALLPRNLMLSPPSITMGNPVTSTSSFNANVCISEMISDPAKTHQISALSPSNSSLSSSPLSFASVGSPANLQSSRIPIASGQMAYPNGAHTVFTNRTAYSDLNNSSFLPPLSVPGNLTQSCLTQTIPSHRRKSPLFKNHLQESIANNSLFESDDGFSDNEISSGNTHSTSTINKPPNAQHKLNLNDSNRITPNFHLECARKIRINNNSNLNAVSYKTQSLLSDNNESNNDIDFFDQQSDCHSCKTRSKASLDKSRTNSRNSVTERLKRSKLKRTIKHCGLTESKAVPTRVLPPRQRYSRWSLPRPYPITANNLGNDKHVNEWTDDNKTESTNSGKERKQEKIKLLQWDYDDHIKRNGLDPLFNFMYSDDDGEAGNNNKNSNKSLHDNWPPLSKVEYHQVDTTSDSMNTLLKKAESANNNTISSCDSYEDYCLPNHNIYCKPSNLHLQCSSNYITNDNRETSDVPEYLSYPSASVFCCHSSTTNVCCSSINQFHSASYDMHANRCLSHNNSNSSNDNLRISQSIGEPKFVTDDSTAKTYFLNKTTDNNSVTMSSTSGKSALPTWASVFLSDDDGSDLDCLFSENKHSDESFNLFSNESFESGIHSSSTLHSSPISLSSPSSSSLPTTSCSLTTSSYLFKTDKTESDLFINDSKHVIESSNIHPSTVSNNNNNPILEELGLDSVELDFDSLNELVEGDGNIPLDIDFNLTAGFNNDNFLDSSDSLTHEWNTSSSSLVCTNTNHNVNNSIPDNLLCNKVEQQNQPQWPENLTTESDIMQLQQALSNDSQWLNDTHIVSGSNNLTIFLSEASAHMFEENFNENVVRMRNE
ncbi:Forkhead box protein isoform 1 [Schistosoma japonicum]|uniref:Forkhead box protein isoform 1 n=2 Tax=Schistosoma japonicum TaxID=6182 RepID=A0A4Z2DWG2_SCHJA|nr:Forkhead box protein isoform 1 [Schistosoma japonicum]